MSAKQIILVLGSLLLLTGSVFGQGEFLKYGESGFGVSPQATFGRGAGGYGLSLGYSAKGYVDIGFAYSKNTNNNTHGYVPSVTAYFKHPHRSGIFGVGISIGYASVKTTDNFLGGFTLFNNFYVSRSTLLHASVSVASLTNLNSGGEGGSTTFNINTALVFARRSAFRPFVNLGITVPESEDIDFYGNIGGGFVVVW